MKSGGIEPLVERLESAERELWLMSDLFTEAQRAMISLASKTGNPSLYEDLNKAYFEIRRLVEDASTRLWVMRAARGAVHGGLVKRRGARAEHTSDSQTR